MSRSPALVSEARVWLARLLQHLFPQQRWCDHHCIESGPECIKQVTDIYKADEKSEYTYK